MKLLLRVVYVAVALLIAIGAATGVAAIGAYYYVAPSLPAVESLKDVRLQVPLRVYKDVEPEITVEIVPEK